MQRALLIIVIFFAVCECAIYLNAPDPVKLETIPIFFREKIPFKINGTLSLDQRHAFFFDANDSIINSVAMWHKLDRSIIRAVIFPYPSGNPLGLGSKFMVLVDAHIPPLYPCVQIANEKDSNFLKEVLMNESNIEVVIDSEGVNIYSDIYQNYPMYIFQGLFIAFDVLIAAGSGYKIYLFYSIGSDINIGIICMFLNIASAICRIISLIDPLGIVGFTNEYRFTIVFLNYPFTLGSALVISFYWMEILYFLDSKMKSFIYVLRFPFLITISILIIAEIVVNVINIALSLQYEAEIAQYVLLGFYSLIGFFVSIFYFIVSIKVVEKSYKVTKSSNKIKYVNRLRNKIVVNAISLFIFALLPIIFSYFFGNPYAPYFLMILIYGTSSTINLCELLIFDPDKKKMSGFSKKKKNTDTKSNPPSAI